MASLSVTVNIPASNTRTAEVFWAARGAQLAAAGVEQGAGNVTSGNLITDGAQVIGTWTYTPTSGNP